MMPCLIRAFVYSGWWWWWWLSPAGRSVTGLSTFIYFLREMRALNTLLGHHLFNITLKIVVWWWSLKLCTLSRSIQHSNWQAADRSQSPLIVGKVQDRSGPCVSYIHAWCVTSIVIVAWSIYWTCILWVTRTHGFMPIIIIILMEYWLALPSAQNARHRGGVGVVVVSSVVLEIGGKQFT